MKTLCSFNKKKFKKRKEKAEGQSQLSLPKIDTQQHLLLAGNVSIRTQLVPGMVALSAERFLAGKNQPGTAWPG